MSLPPPPRHTLHVAAGHQGVVGRAALDVVASRGADDELRGVRVFRLDVGGVPLGGKEGIGLCITSVSVSRSMMSDREVFLTTAAVGKDQVGSQSKTGLRLAVPRID